MDLRLLREFMFLSKDLNFTKTAERCYLSQSVLSRHIQALEAELGCQLVTRDKHGVRLTPYGESFAESCRRIDADYAEALAELDTIRGGFTETLRIAYVSPLASALIDRAYALQLERYPQIKLDLMASWEERAVVLLNQDKVDLSIYVVFEDPDPEVYSSLSLYDDHYVVLMPADHPLAEKRSVTPRSLKGEMVLIPSSRDFPVQYSHILPALEPVKDATVRASLNNRHDAIALTKAGKGLSLVRSQLLADADTEGLAVIPLKEETLTFDVRAVWKCANHRQPLKDFLGILKELCA